MRLLATSTPTKRNTVRVLFYGQSITEQAWSGKVAEWLRKTYPDANLVIENRAIGGHSSQLLWRTAEADLYPFQPDLLIFYVYGSNIDYEKIIANVRRRTTAEVLIQNDHLTQASELEEPTKLPTMQGGNWSAWMSEVFLPDLAKRYDVELLDQRKQWRQYLTANRLQPQALLKDGVHLNDWGCYVMAELVQQRLVYSPKALNTKHPTTPRDFTIGKEAHWTGDRLVLEFEGSRIDLIAGGSKASAPNLKVLIDGAPPSQHPALYATTRASSYPNSNWPIVKRVSLGGMPQPEEWTAKIREASEDGKHFKFELIGSKTGPDGEGTSDKPFISNSKRIAIEPEDWNLEYCKAVFKTPIPADLETCWKVVPQSVDFVSQQVAPAPGIEASLTLAQGLPNATHTLELIAEGGKKPNVRALRAYKPPFK